MKIKLTFTEPVLGTMSGNKELAEEFIIAKHPDGLSKDEIEALYEGQEILEKKTTFFPRVDDEPIIWDYQVKGFFKGACEALIHTGEWTKEQLKKFRLTPYLFKKTINTQVFVFPRTNKIKLSGEITFLERPLRGETMKGERISLARSEVVPASSSIEIEIQWLNDNLDEWIRRWLDYGKYVGMLQWRTASFGRFKWKELQ